MEAAIPTRTIHFCHFDGLGLKVTTVAGGWTSGKIS